MKNPAPRLAAEFIGAFALVFVGVGAVMTSSTELLIVAIAHGLAIAVMATALAGISGAHFNPAISFAMYVTQRMTLAEFASYAAAQLVGGAAAAFVLDKAFAAAAVPTMSVAAGVSVGTALILEALMTFFLVLVFFTVAVDSKGAFGSVAAFPIGLAITMGIFVGGPVTGAAMNPARWFGPAAVNTNWANWSVWIIGPLLGATLAALVFDYVLKNKGKSRRRTTSRAKAKAA